MTTTLDEDSSRRRTMRTGHRTQQRWEKHCGETGIRDERKERGVLDTSERCHVPNNVFNRLGWDKNVWKKWQGINDFKTVKVPWDKEVRSLWVSVRLTNVPLNGQLTYNQGLHILLIYTQNGEDLEPEQVHRLRFSPLIFPSYYLPLEG